MGETYLVTGGSGFVGLAVVKMLCKESRDNVSHVKVIDLSFPEEMKVAVQKESVEGPSFEWIVCDITDRTQVFKAMEGCNIVFHIASVVPGRQHDFGGNMHKVNVIGSRNIVDACRGCGVRGLVYMSTVGIMGPNIKRDAMRYVTEECEYDCLPRSLYGETKKIAEDYVLAANGHINDNGTKLITCSLRPPFIYGQNYSLLKSSYEHCYWKTVPSLCSSDVEQSCIYVGNLAIATITVAKQLKKKSDLIGGQYYFIKDDSPPLHVYKIISRCFAPLGFKLSKEPVLPFPLTYAIFWLFFMINSLMYNLGLSTKILPSPNFMWRSNATILISHHKFIEHFNFKPQYTPNEAFQKTEDYVTRMKENDFQKPVFDFEY